jgi:hypothetical protein
MSGCRKSSECFSPPGRGRSGLRQRVGVEHRLAHISAGQGRHAHYIGVRKNVFDLRRAAAGQNLETIHRRKLRRMTMLSIRSVLCSRIAY